MLTSIRPWGNSQGLCVSRDMLNAAGIELHDKVELVLEDGGIVIRPYRPLEEKKQAALNLQSMRRKADDFDYRDVMNSYLDERYMNE